MFWIFKIFITTQIFFNVPISIIKEFLKYKQHILECIHFQTSEFYLYEIFQSVPFILIQIHFPTKLSFLLIVLRYLPSN